MRSNRLSVKLNIDSGEILGSNHIHFFIDPIDLSLENRDSTQDEILVVLSIGVTGFVNVEKMHSE